VNARTTQMDDLRLIALPSAVNCADLFVRFSLSEWALSALVNDATYAAGQLVGAAVASADPRSPGFITVRLRLRGDCLVIEVEDERRSSTMVLPATLPDSQIGIVNLEQGGALIWCELPLPIGLTAAEVRLPRREQRRSPAAQRLASARPSEEDAAVDPQVIQRIFTALSRPSGPDRR